MPSTGAHPYLQALFAFQFAMDGTPRLASPSLERVTNLACCRRMVRSSLVITLRTCSHHGGRHQYAAAKLLRRKPLARGLSRRHGCRTSLRSPARQRRIRISLLQSRHRTGPMRDVYSLSLAAPAYRACFHQSQDVMLIRVRESSYAIER